MARSLVNPRCRINQKNLSAPPRLQGGTMPVLNEETRITLASDADGAEAQNYVAAGGGAAETHHGTEAREQEHLIELMAEVDALGAGDNLVGDHLAVLIHGDIDEQTVRERKLHIVLLGCPG